MPDEGAIGDAEVAQEADDEGGLRFHRVVEVPRTVAVPEAEQIDEKAPGIA